MGIGYLLPRISGYSYVARGLAEELTLFDVDERQPVDLGARLCLVTG